MELVRSANVNLLIVFAIMVFLSTTIIFLLRGSYASRGNGAARKAAVFLIITDILFLLGSVFFFGATGSFVIHPGSELIGIINDSGFAHLFQLSITVLAVAFFAKLGMVPLHWWIMDVLETRSLFAINAILILYRAVILLIMLKIFLPIALLWGSYLTVPLFITAILSISVGNLLSLKSKNIVSVLAYSSITNLGYVLVLFPALAVDNGMGSIAMIIAIIVFVFSHLGAFSALSNLSLCGESSFDFAEIDGLGTRRPGLALVLSIFLLSLAGAPVTLGFIARFLMLKELAFGSFYVVYIFVALNLILSVYNYSRPIVRMYVFKQTKVPSEEPEYVSYFQIAITAFALIAMIYLGIFPESLVRWVQISLGT